MKRVIPQTETHTNYSNINHMYFFMEPRPVEILVKDFSAAAGNFEEFYNGMDEREKLLFKGYLHQLRVEAHSPLVTANVETTTAPLF